jgi:hypothetical protein
MWLLVKYILTAAARDKIFLSFFLLVIVGVSLSIFLGSSAVTEKDQFSIVFTASMLRISSVFTLSLFCIFYIRKSFDTRDVEFMLTKPITRLQYLWAHSLTFFLLASAMSVLLALTLFLMPMEHDFSGLTLWTLSIWVELCIVASISIFFAFVLSNAVSATLATLAFYTLSRMIGGILGVINSTAETSIMLIMEKIMLIISIFIPRLDLLGQGSWLFYGVDLSVSWSFIILQGLFFIGMVSVANYLDFQRKQF